MKRKNLFSFFLTIGAVLFLFGCSPKIASMAQANGQFNVVEATIDDAQQAIKKGQCSCEQLVQTYFDRINAYDQSTKLNSIVVTNPAALEAARQLDDEWRKTGKLHHY